jgi:hypothetical protein
VDVVLLVCIPPIDSVHKVEMLVECMVALINPPLTLAWTLRRPFPSPPLMRLLSLMSPPEDFGDPGVDVNGRRWWSGPLSRHVRAWGMALLRDVPDNGSRRKSWAILATRGLQG